MDFQQVYLIGIGGIGMSAIARYFRHEGYPIAGYDRVETPLTQQLQAEGMQIHYNDNTKEIPQKFLDPKTTLVVYTPAIPKDHKEYNYFKNNNFQLVKRSKILGVIAQKKYVMAISGTHGKTTTTTMTAYFNHIAGGGGSAFLGGISKNFQSNLVLGKGDRLAVEADEFDRSFLQLYPNVAVITAADADHLDIYGTHEAVKEAFRQFASQVKEGGAVIIKKGVELDLKPENRKIYTYAYNSEADFFATNVTLLDGGYYSFDIVCPDRTIKGCKSGIPGWVNIENTVAAVSLLWCAGFDEELLKEAIATFTGVKRRFDFYINTPKIVYMDDYAHHPAELRAALTSLRGMFPNRKITAAFQPHLYSRTQDFAPEFAESLSLADEVLLTPIYPAREEPIEGVTSELIFKDITCKKTLIEKSEICTYLESADTDVFVTFGAGDIENYCAQIAETLTRKYLDK